MAATTGQLGLLTPTQGDLSGVWGDTVNNGITEYTNIAIAGTLTLTGDGAVTLANTTGNNTTSNITSTLTGAGTVTAQFAIVKVTGTLTTPKIITAPSYSKTYVVVNAATGSTVSFIRSGQTPAVSIAVGETAFVYYNGTDYVKLTGTATAGAAGGSNTQVQFNSSGVLAGSSNMTFNGTTLTVNDLTDSSLTATRVIYAGASGNLVDSANLTFNGTTLTANTLNLTNALGTIYGGTGLTSFTSGGVVYASSSSALATNSNLTYNGTALTTTTTSGIPLVVTGTGSVGARIIGGTGAGLGSYLSFQAQGANAAIIGTEASIVGSGTSNNLMLYGYATNSIIMAPSTAEVARFTSTGLGIGTSAPAAKFEVSASFADSAIEEIARISRTGGTTSYATNRAGALTFFDTPNSTLTGAVAGVRDIAVGNFRGSLAFYTTNAGAQATSVSSLVERLRINSDGNLGLGVTPSAWGTLNALQVKNTAWSSDGNVATLTGNAYYDGSNFRYIANGASCYYQINNGGGFNWNIAGSGTAGNVASFTSAMTLTTAGKLGIGTTSPNGLLQIGSGNGGGNVPTTSALQFGANNSIVTFLGANDNESIDGVIGSWNTVYNHQNAKIEFFKSANCGSIRFYTQNGSGITERLRIHQDGAFGLSGANYGTAGQVLTSGGSGVTPTWTTVSGGGTPGGSDTQIQYNNSGAFGGSAIFTFNKSTTAPVVTLGGASGVTSTVLQLRAPSATNGPYVGFSLGNADAALFWTHDSVGNFPFRFVAAGQEFARFDASGNFGIGTTSPGGKLDVKGNLSANNTIYLTNGNAGNYANIIQTRDSAGTLNSSIIFSSFDNSISFTQGASSTERMRINSAGSLLVGTTAQLTTNLLHTITKAQGPTSSSTAWADQLGPLAVYGDFGNGGGSQQQSSALTVVGWASFGAPGALIRGWWSSNGPNLGTPTLQFQVASTGNVTNTNNSYGSLSDARIKENITDATPKLDGIKQLRVVNFNLKTDPKKLKQIGLIAQEVEQVFPAMVESDLDAPDNMKSVKYSVLVPMLVKAMQEQQAIIESLKARLDAANL
jgi:hypothetical protein